MAQTWQWLANLSLFLALLAISIIVLPAMVGQRVNINLASDIVGSLMLIAGVAIAWGRGGPLTIGIAVAIPWASPGRFSPVWNEGWTIAAILVIGYILLAQVFPAGPINAVRVQGAVAAYLLLWVAYAHGYQITEYFNASSVTSTEGPMTSLVDWIYQSFSTLSTLGYGDIIPTGRTSRMLAIGEGFGGQLFLAILIARLVAMQVSATSASESSRERGNHQS